MGALDGKAAIITGAATGIGRATALLFARAGARLTLADTRDDELARTVGAVRQAGGEAVPVTADLARPEDCAAVVAAAVSDAGRIDVLFNNAGVGTMTVGGTVETIELDKWDLALDVNVRAMYLVSRAAVPALRGAGGGSIINTASVSAFRGSASRPSHAYAASKGAVLALTRAMAASRPHPRERDLSRHDPDAADRGHHRARRARGRRGEADPALARPRARGHRALRALPRLRRRLVDQRHPDRGRRRRARRRDLRPLSPRTRRPTGAGAPR